MPIRDWMQPDAWYEKIDPGIRFAVRLLHSYGIDTGQSCEGGEGHAYDHPTIDLGGGGVSNTAGFAALAALNAYRLPVWTIEYVWTLDQGIPDDSFWRIVFREPMLDKAGQRPMFVRHYQADPLA